MPSAGCTLSAVESRSGSEVPGCWAVRQRVGGNSSCTEPPSRGWGVGSGWSADADDAVWPDQPRAYS